MATNHEYQVLGIQVDFSSSPVLPLKLFTVTGSVSAKIIPVIENGFNTDDAILHVGTSGEAGRLLYMDTDYEEVVKAFLPITGDIYITETSDEGVDITSGIVTFYCVFAPLSADGEVEEAE